MTDKEIVKAFRGLYSGGAAQKLRDAGVPDHLAMPPWADVWWFGKQVSKCPMDLWVYQEIIVETRPDVLLETGTSTGGSAFYFASLFDRLGNGRVITVDKDEYRDHWVKHPRVTYLVGDSVSGEVIERMKETDGRVMVSLDSLHTCEHVVKELAAYSPMVSSGCYLVVEDVIEGLNEPIQREWGSGAAEEFMTRHAEFVRDASREKHLLTSNLWLRRV